MSFDRIQNTTSQQLEPVVLPAAAGGMLSGVAYNTAGLVVAYRTELTSTWTTVTLVAGTVGTWVSSSWAQDTTGPLSGGAGLYQLCLPSSAYNQAGATRLFIMVALSTIQNGYVLIERDLGAANPQDGQRLGLTALPASGVLAVNPSLAINQSFNNLGQTQVVPANVTQIAGQTASAAAAVTFPATIAAPGDSMVASNMVTLPADYLSATEQSRLLSASTALQAASYSAPLTSTQTQAAAAAAITAAEPIAATVAGAGNAALTVTVTNSVTTGKVSGATVTLINSAGGVQSNGTTNSSGVTVPALGANAAVYTLVTEASGYLGASQTVTLDPGANPAAVALAPIAVPSPITPNFCAMTGTTYNLGVAAAGVAWTITVTALPSGFPDGDLVVANQFGNSLADGAIGYITPPNSTAAVQLPQGATYSISIGNGEPLIGQIVPSASTGVLPKTIG